MRIPSINAAQLEDRTAVTVTDDDGTEDMITSSTICNSVTSGDPETAEMPFA